MSLGETLVLHCTLTMGGIPVPYSHVSQSIFSNASGHLDPKCASNERLKSSVATVFPANSDRYDFSQGSRSLRGKGGAETRLKPRLKVPACQG